MKIFLLGYMGAGKSLIGRLLADAIKLEFLDFDELIAAQENKSVSEVFKTKGEIYFRKKEHELLQAVLAENKDAVVSLGGGTPCYGNNMNLIKDDASSHSVYLKADLNVLTSRLYQEKDSRPLISHLKEKEKLEEFLRKHLFERGFYYNQSEFIVTTGDKTPEEIVAEIVQKLD